MDRIYPVTKLPVILTQKKVCNTCKKHHKYAPTGTIVCNEGHLWWNCECHSTLIMLKTKVGIDTKDLAA